MKMIISCVLLLITVAGFADDKPSVAGRPFRVPNGEVINLQIPDAFSTNVTQPAKDLPPVVQFRSKQGKAASMTLQLLPAPEGRFDSQEKINAGVERKGATYASGSVEKKVQLVTIKSAAGSGAYATFTDASLVNAKPRPGQYKVVTTGLFSVSKTLVVFELLADSEADANYKLGIELLQSGLSLGEALPPKPVVPEFLTIPVSKQGWQITAIAPALVEYAGRFQEDQFQYQARSEQGFNLSLFVEEPPKKEEGHVACFDHYWPLAKRNPMIDQQSVQVMKGETFVKVEYFMKSEKEDLKSHHINYFFMFRGHWVDLHISQTPWAVADQAMLSRFEKSLKYEATPVLDDPKSVDAK